MDAAPVSPHHAPVSKDLFAVAAALRAAEIARYKADPSLRAPVMLSLRNDPNAKIRWPAKF
ncbi:hypothetical protein NON20_23690 (plasmid) [Synechocystis sp. B12]|nr:hypothetical protein NON20_23690 [Synechocystis sp. B12]